MNDDYNTPRIDPSENDPSSLLAPPVFEEPAIPSVEQSVPPVEVPVTPTLEQAETPVAPEVPIVEQQATNETTQHAEGNDVENATQEYVENPNPTTVVEQQSGTEQLEEISSQINGMNKGKKFLIVALIAVVAFVIMKVTGIGGTFSIGGFSFTMNNNSDSSVVDDSNDWSDSSSDTSSDTTEFDGMFAFSSDDVHEVFVVTPPSEYDSKDYSTSYHFEGLGVEFDLNGLQNYTDAKKLANSVYNYYKKGYDDSAKLFKSQGMNPPATLSEPTKTEKKTANGIDWYVVRSYYGIIEANYFTKQDNVVYLLDIKAQTKDLLDNTEKTIVNSIKLK